MGRMHFFGFIRLMLLALAVCLSDLHADAAPRVIVTLKPLHSLVSAVMAGVGRPELLLADKDDPHDHTLTIERIEAMRGADMVFWMSPNLESFLIKPLKVHKIRHYAFITTPALRVLYARDSSGCYLKEACNAPEPYPSALEADRHEAREWTAADPHAWLNIDNAILMVREIARQLSAIDLGHADIYHDNARHYIARLEALKREVAKMSIQHLHFIAFHNAYKYIEKSSNIRNSADEIVSVRRPNSLKALEQIRKILWRREASCIVYEPQQPAKLEKQLSQEFPLPLVQMDPLGTLLTPGPDLYPVMMKRIFLNFQKCSRAQDNLHHKQ